MPSLSAGAVPDPVGTSTLHTVTISTRAFPPPSQTESSKHGPSALGQAFWHEMLILAWVEHYFPVCFLFNGDSRPVMHDFFLDIQQHPKKSHHLHLVFWSSLGCLYCSISHPVMAQSKPQNMFIYPFIPKRPSAGLSPKLKWPASFLSFLFCCKLFSSKTSSMDLSSVLPLFHTFTCLFVCFI